MLRIRIIITLRKRSVKFAVKKQQSKALMQQIGSGLLALRTHSASPHVDSVRQRLDLINPEGLIQPDSVLLRLAVFVGEALHRLDVGERLRGNLVGFS